jgi:hypothetical protein
MEKSDPRFDAIYSLLMLGLSQWSFEYIEVALYTITKSTSIIFILFFAIIMGLERKVSVITYDADPNIVGSV